MATATLRNVYRGNVVRCSVEFKDVNDVYADPTTIAVQYKDPDGTITIKTFGVDAEVIRTNIGRYYIDVTATKKGKWLTRFSGTGSLIAAALGEFTVLDDPFA